MTLGLLGGAAVSIVHAETPTLIRINPFRKATGNEEITFHQSRED